jgi:hypothetical protein
MTAQDHHDDDQSGVRERLGGVVHAVQHAVADHVAPAVDAVTSALHEAGHAATHLGGRQPSPAPDTGPDLVPSGTRIVRPGKGGATFLAWRDGQWTPVHREHGTGWVWSA